MLLVIMGVSGSGKSTLGMDLARRLGWAYLEGDDLHPPGNVAKMKAGQPLSDDDREPWLAAIAAQLRRWQDQGVSAVASCSALRAAYRHTLMSDLPAGRLIYLRVAPEVAVQRVAARTGHFMPATLVVSQFQTLEEPDASEAALWVDAEQPLADLAIRILAALGLMPAVRH